MEALAKEILAVCKDGVVDSVSFSLGSAEKTSTSELVYVYIIYTLNAVISKAKCLARAFCVAIWLST